MHVLPANKHPHLISKKTHNLDHNERAWEREKKDGQGDVKWQRIWDGSRKFNEMNHTLSNRSVRVTQFYVFIDTVSQCWRAEMHQSQLHRPTQRLSLFLCFIITSHFGDEQINFCWYVSENPQFCFIFYVEDKNQSVLCWQRLSHRYRCCNYFDLWELFVRDLGCLGVLLTT